MTSETYYSKKKYDFLHYKLTLYALRTNKGISQSEMADYLGVSQPLYSRHEQGEVARVSTKFAQKICSKFNISLDDLFIPLSPAKRDMSITDWAVSEEARPYIEEAYKKYLADIDKKKIQRGNLRVLK